MSSRKISFTVNEYYHIYNRGNSKQIIFHDHQDYERFIGLLYACNQGAKFKILNLLKGQSLYDITIDRNIIAIGSYCLMSNHFHLLVREIEENGLTTFMRKVMTGYVMYYNKKYKRTGKLFEGAFKAEHVSNDRYLKYLFAYIHMNPVKIIDPDWKILGIKDITNTKSFLKKYDYSSFITYIGVQRVQNKIINKFEFPSYFPTPLSMWSEINSWLDFQLGIS